MKLTILKTEKHQSKLKDKGEFWYIFFKGEDGLSYKTCVYEKFRNYRNWQGILGLTPGSEIEVNIVRGNLVDADNQPKVLRKECNPENEVS